MAVSAKSSMATIEQFIARVGHQKAAEEAHTEAGSIGGETSHPVKNVDDRTEVAQEGERSKENTSDVKEEQGSASVDSTPEATTKSGSVAQRLAKKAGENPFTKNVKKTAPTGSATDKVKKADGGPVQSEGSAADDSEESVLNPQPTGKTPDIETNSAKGGKEDPGSSHEARTDNDKLDGHKYANDADPIKIASDLKGIGDNLLAQLSWVSEQLGQTKAAEDVQQVAQQRGNVPQQRQQVKQAAPVLDQHVQAQLGWEMAGLINGTMDKQAADLMVKSALEQVIYDASTDAVKLAHYLDNFFYSAEQAQKQAEGEGDPMAAMGGGGGDPMGGGGAPPPPMGGGAPDAMGGGGGGEDEMMAALGGGEGADPSGGGGGEGGGGGDDAQHLAQILDQLGVSPEELQQAIQEEMGGGGGEEGGDAGGDPLAGGAAPPGMGGGEKPAFDRRGGRQTKQGAAKAGNYQAGMAEYISELISRSRRK